LLYHNFNEVEYQTGDTAKNNLIKGKKNRNKKKSNHHILHTQRKISQ